MLKKSLLAVSAVLAASAVALAGCAGGAADAGSAEGRTLNTLLTTDPSTFDPATATGGDDYLVDRMLYDSVLRRDDDSAIVGGLATEWTAESASEYTFTIRGDATCSDGTAITASVVANSLSYFADPATGSNFRNLVFGPGEATITADDDAATVEIALSEPFANLERGLTLAQSGIICPAGLDDLEGLAAGTVEGAFSGPYSLTDAQPGIGYDLALREDYDAWPDFATPLEAAPSAIHYSLATDASTTANQLLSGDLDLGSVTGDTVDRFEAGDFNAVDTIAAGVYVIFNEQEGSVFAGAPELRKAVAQAIDQEAYNTVFSDGRSPLYTSVVSPSYACVNTDTSLLESYDPDAAASVLDSVSIGLIQSTAFGDAGAGGEYIQQALSAAGADVDLESTDNAAWATTINTPGSDWDMTIMGDINATQVISASLERVMGTPVSEGGRSIGAADNAEGAAALAEGLATADPDQQCAAFQRAQESMFERDDVVPLAGLVMYSVSPADVTVRAFGDYLDPATVRFTD